MQGSDEKAPSGAVMTAAQDSDVQRLAKALAATFDLSNLSLPQEYSYASLPLCVIDAVFSIGVTYGSTRNTVARWCESQGWARLKGQGPERTISEFLAILNASTPEDLATLAFGNQQRTSSKSGILKADAVKRFAGVLAAHGVERLGDTEDSNRNEKLRAAIALIPGQGTGISFDYFLMLSGSDGFVKADRMVCRYVGEVLGRTIAPNEAGPLLTAAANALNSDWPNVTPRLIDYAVWDRQRAIAS